MELLGLADQPEIAGASPNALFSLLAPTSAYADGIAAITALVDSNER